MKHLFYILAFFSIGLLGCTSSGYSPLGFDADSQEATDNQLIIDHLTANKITNAKNTPSGIYYMIETPGTGESPSVDSKIKAHYTGTLLNGEKFDSSHDRGQPLQFALNGVIKGWGESIPMLKKGGKGKFIIPSGLAYGPRKVGRKIPENSVLIFEIELVDFEDATK